MEGQLIFKNIVRKCDHCRKEFIHKWVKREQQHAKLNQVDYWTEGNKTKTITPNKTTHNHKIKDKSKQKLNKTWSSYKLLCRACLKEWFQKEKGKKIFRQTIPNQRKRITFSTYYRRGDLSVDDSVGGYNKKWGTNFINGN